MEMRRNERRMGACEREKGSGDGREREVAEKNEENKKKTRRLGEKKEEKRRESEMINNGSKEGEVRQ